MKVCWGMVLAGLLGLARWSEAALVSSVTHGDVAYFLFDGTNRIERYDLAAEAWLATLPLARTSTALAVDGDGIYLGSNTQVWRMALDGTGGVLLTSVSHRVHGLHVRGTQLFVVYSYSLYAQVASMHKVSGARISTVSAYVNSLFGSSFAPGIGKLFGRTQGVIPADIVQVPVAADGTLGSVRDSAYHGDLPEANRTFLYPDETRVVDDSGTIYATSNLTYVGSLYRTVSDLAIHAGTPLVLQSNTLHSYASNGLTWLHYRLSNVTRRILVRGETVYAFHDAAGRGMDVQRVPWSALQPEQPAPVLDPTRVVYRPTEVALGPGDVVYLLSPTNRNVFRYSVPERRYLESIPLIGPPTHMAVDPVLNRLYVSYSSGLLTWVDLAAAAPREAPFANSPAAPRVLSAAGPYLFVCDDSGAGVSHFTYGPDGTRLSQVEMNYYSTEFVWSEARRKMYFFRDDTSPNDLYWEDIGVDGRLGAKKDSPYNSNDGISHPIRVRPDGALVLLGSGRLYEPVTLAQTGALPHQVVDAVWKDEHLFTLRAATNNHAEIDGWSVGHASWTPHVITGTPVRLFAVDEGFALVVTRAGNTAIVVPEGITDLVPLRIEGSPAPRGTPTPQGYGMWHFPAGTVITNGVPALVETGGVRHVCEGWTGTGSAPAAGAGLEVVCTLDAAARITWRWREDAYQLQTEWTGPGTVTPATAWHLTNTLLKVSAVPDPGQRFVRWLGDVSADQATQAVLEVRMDRPVRVHALFAHVRGDPVALAGDWPSFGNGPAHRGYVAGTLGAGRFTNRWTAIRTGEVKQVAAADGRVFVGAGRGSFSALDAASGTTLWHRALLANVTQGAPTWDAGQVFVEARHTGDAGTLWSFQDATGATNWQTACMLSLLYGSPVVASDAVYTVAFGTNLPVNLELVGHGRSDGARRFAVPAENRTYNYSGWMPALQDGRLFRFVAGTFAEHDPATGQVLWSLFTGWPSGSSFANMQASVALGEGRAHYAGRTNLVAVDLATRAIAWRLAGTYLYTPALANGFVYAVTPTGVEERIAMTGDLLKFFPVTNVVDQPIVTDDSLIVSAAAGTRIFDLASGALLQVVPAAGRISLADHTLYVARTNGGLEAFGAAVPLQLAGVPSNTLAECGDPLPWPAVQAVGGCEVAPPAVTTQEWRSGVCPTVVTRVWQATGRCGLSIGATQTITLVDQQPPTLVGVPGPQALMCGEALPPVPAVQALDACGTTQVDFAESAATGCPGVVVRTWTATDTCGLQAVATQVLTYVEVDRDGDGLDYATEVQLGTDPNQADSDRDGRPDGLEVARGFDPRSATNFPRAVRNDCDGDGESDLLVYHRASSIWFAACASCDADRYQVAQWGWPGPAPVPGDFDGDAVVDFAVHHADFGSWYVRQSSTGRPLLQNWGWRDTRPVVGDYDGDGRHDFAVYHPAAGNWYVRRSRDGSMLLQNWGWASATPVPGDYDGDGTTDLAVYHQATGNWYIRRSRDASLFKSNWGWAAAVPVPADYDGDGSTDLAVYHPASGDWLVRMSRDGVLWRQNWGWSAATPVPADYDHDGRADPAVYDTATGWWYLFFRFHPQPGFAPYVRLRPWGPSGSAPALSP